MAKFTVAVPLNMRWFGNDISGAANATHRIPDALQDEFAAAFASLPGLTWVEDDEIGQINTEGLTAKYDKAGGTISGAVTVTGALVAQSTVSAVGTATLGNVIASAVTATTARFKGAPWFDVRAYGATGDGTTNDLTAFNSATSAAAAAGGGVIYVPSGSYYLANEWNINVDKVHVELASDATVFTTAPTTSGHTVGFIGGGVGLGTATTPKNSWASIRGGTVYNTGNSTSDNAIGFARFKNAVCENVRITTAGRKGITAQYGVDHVRIVNNNIGTTGMGGITLEVSVTDALISGNFISSAGAGQIDNGEAAGIAVLSGCENVHIENNVLLACGSFGIRATSTTSLWIERNRLPTCSSNAISIASSANVHLGQNDLASARFGIAITTTSNGIVLIGNSISAAGSSVSATYDAFYFDNCAVRPVLSGNRLAGTTHKFSINCVSMAAFGPDSSGNIMTAGASGIYGGTRPFRIDDVVDSIVKRGSGGEFVSETYIASNPPSTGTWARGDRAWNILPSAGGTPGWICTTGGSPGTWKAMAVLAA